MVINVVVKPDFSTMSNDEKEKYRTKCEVYSRIVGYLRPVDQWNDGKQTEFEDRVVFKPDTQKKEKAVRVDK